jgi:signal transduction histidine kinase
LLDPAAWQEGLEKYALAMHLAVALVDADGRLLGPCLNPQSLWELLRARQPAGAEKCPFALAPLTPCTCIADALAKGHVVRARERTGLVHFAVPLALGEQKLGALVAGQVFDHYPEQLPLEQMATKLGLSKAKVWQTARLEHPVSPSMLQVYEDLLATHGQAFLHGRYHTLLDASRLAELRKADDLLRRANDELEKRVAERTAALEESQKKALQAERLAAIGQVVTGLAHESRNALQRCQSCLAMLGLRLQDRPDALDLLGRLQKAQDDLHRLFDDVRDYAAPIRLEPGGCHLAEVWREAWADLAPLRKGKDAELREETDGVDLWCVSSRFHLKQVFRNLLDNALTAGGEPVRVVIACSPAAIEGAPAVQVAVRDNGPGFTKEQRQKVFEPFCTTKVHGTGLGLAICKRIVEAHGGRIAVGEGAEPGAEILVTLARREV